MSQYSSLDQVFEAFSKLRVLIIGDVMLDSYVWGSTERISPEAPVPVVKVNRQEQRLGGAANVALNVQALGATPVLCSLIGDDLAGTKFVDLLQQQQIATEGIIRSINRITTVKERILSGSQHILRVDTETDTAMESLEENSLIAHIQQLMESADVVIFEDYDKGALTARVIRETISFARQRAVPTVVDPKFRNFKEYQQASLFKPNLKEIRDGLRVDVNPEEQASLAQAATALREQLQVEQALITLGSKGMYFDDGQDHHHTAAQVRSISDVSGAGDTVVSIAALCRALNLPSRFMVQLANLGGGIVCEYLGVVPIERSRLEKEAEARDLKQLL